MKPEEFTTAERYFEKYKIGTIFAIHDQCNSKFRELKYAYEDNDAHRIEFWTKRIKVLTEVTDLLHKCFYAKQHTIKSKEDFHEFMQVFKRFAALKMQMSYYEIATGGPK